MGNTNKGLSSKTCTPCQGGVPALNADTALQMLPELGEGWIINKEGKLYKKYNFHNFIDAMKFANKVAELAEIEGHHPDLEISWGKCVIKVWTHKINGLTENDFILAAKINNLV